ncbi:MAG TPA: extracellular solute-binding protein [Candidatus Saccharimonadales bacterium]|jgi:multiple sugar transport system substrate-binding protein|nr:extracellular solute-binding protein [Candidatus Saccharimonadales bacterium]
MAKKRGLGVSRRDFMKIAGVSAVAGAGPAFLFPERAAAQQKTLKILQWSHFVPAWDKWFNETYTKEWGQKNNTNVIVDNINLVDLKTRASAEISAQKGHDLFMLLSPPAAYEKQVIDMTHVYQEVERKWGKKIDLAHKSTYNPKTKKYFAFSDAYTPDPGNWRRDLWTEAGFPNGPDTWEDLRVGAKRIKDKSGHPCGLGLSQELDTSMALRALLWSFGGAEQDEHGNVTINSKNTVEALKFMKALYEESETKEVFTWTPPSNNQAMLAGKVSYVANAISITRQSERDNMPIDSNIMISRALKGPVRRIAAEHVMNCYVVWEFAENKDGAQKFLIDYMDHFHEGFVAGQFYNFPCFPKTVPNLKAEISNDPRAHPADKYKVLGDVLDWATNVGYPGYGSAAIDEAFTTWVIPTMFAKVAQGQETAENAAKAAETEYKRIFDRFK